VRNFNGTRSPAHHPVFMSKDGVAYNKIEIRPQPVGDIGRQMQFSFIVWHDKDKLDKSGRVFELNVTIPAIQPLLSIAGSKTAVKVGSGDYHSMSG